MFEHMHLNHPSKDQSSQENPVKGYWSFDVINHTWKLSPEIDQLWQRSDDPHSGHEGLFDGIIAEDQPMVKNLWDQALRDHIPFTCRYRMMINHHIRWFFVHSRLDIYQDQVMALYGTIEDITSHIIHELEDQSLLIAQQHDIASLKQEIQQIKQNNLQVSHAKSTFFSAMSHEIRTPMNAIIGFASLLEQTPLSEEQHEYLVRMKDASSHLLSIVNDILDLSKIDAGKLTIERAPFRIAQLIDDIASLLNNQASRKHLYLDFETLHCPSVVIGDRLRIRQILINLIHNAIKFTETGGVSIVIHTQEIDQNTWLHIKVKDTGIGMTETQQQKLFGDYSQASSSTTRLYGGTGLGLSISQKLAHLMKGSISVSSKLNEGSTFTLSIPVEKDEDDQPEHETIENQSYRKGARILMAEDHLLSQKLSERMFSYLGMTLTVVDNGQRAVHMVKDQDFDLILLDLHMPVIDGLQAAQMIRRFNTKTPIIGLTANQFPEERSQCMLAGMNDLVIKPFDQAMLKKMFVTWIPEE